jgi:hypothetical protein
MVAFGVASGGVGVTLGLGVTEGVKVIVGVGVWVHSGGRLITAVGADV